MIINQKYLIKEILNKYLSFYKCFGDNENGILFLNYSILKLMSICKEWKNEIVKGLQFPRINIMNLDDLGYVSEWIEKYGVPIYDIYFPFHHQQTIFKDNFMFPQLSESIPIIANRITSISFRSGKIDYGGTILLTENTRSVSFGVFNTKEYQKFCSVLVTHLPVIANNLKKLTLTTILYECDIDVSDFKQSIQSLLALESITLASCFQNQIQSLDLIPTLSPTLRKMKLLNINIEYEMLLNMVTIIISSNSNNCNLTHFELNAKFVNHRIKNNNNINSDNNNSQLHDNGVIWEDSDNEDTNDNDNLIGTFDKTSLTNWYHLDGLFELISNWKTLKSFKITMPDETVNVSSVLNFLSSQDNLKTFTFIVKLNDDASGGNMKTINSSIETIKIKSFIQADEKCISMIWNNCSELNRLELHLDGNSFMDEIDGSFYKFSQPELQVSLVSINHPNSNNLFKSISNNVNITSVAIINEIQESDSVVGILNSNHPSIKYLNFNKSDCKNPSALSLIDPIVGNGVVEFLYIGGGLLAFDTVDYQNDNLKLLISIIQQNRKLIHLDFSFNLLPLEIDDETMTTLINSIESNNILQSLTINGCWESSSNFYVKIQQSLLKSGKLISYSDNPY